MLTATEYAHSYEDSGKQDTVPALKAVTTYLRKQTRLSYKHTCYVVNHKSHEQKVPGIQKGSIVTLLLYRWGGLRKYPREDVSLKRNRN